MTDVAVPWGQEELTIKLPEHWTLQQMVRPDLKPAQNDWPDRLAAALAQPSSGLGLEKLLQARRGGRIVLVLEDVTRHSPLPEILPVVMREIRHAGVADSQVEVLFATGMHPPMTAAQAAEKLGEEFPRLAWRSNPSDDPKAHVRIGTVGKLDICIDRQLAAADLRIIISSVSPHLQAGFGGGYKMIVPGCASRETVRGLHRLGLGRSARQLVGTDVSRNVMRTCLDAAGELMDAYGGKTFAVQYLLDANDQPTFMAAGETIPTQRMIAKHCSVACGIVSAGSCDVLLSNAYPRDFDLWQSFKCIANTLWAARPNGVVICLTRCPGGWNGINPPHWPVGALWTRRIVSLLGPEALGSLVLRLVPQLAGDAAFFIRMALQMLHRNHIFIVSSVLHGSGIKFPGVDLFPTPEAALAAADKLLGKGPQRVGVFPYGGITFPVPAVPQSPKES